MLAPLSWLKEYVDITLSPKELGERLTEVGLGTEKITKVDSDIIFELEITPNRPDLLSIIGIAREIAAIEKKRIKFPGVIVTHPEGVIGKHKKILPLEIKTDFKINPRFTGIIIDNVKIGESPNWIKERLAKIGQRPINNIVDITNYVMFELGNPLHAFDYDKIKGHVMKVHKTQGGEKFKSVDEISYHLPKNAVVMSDSESIIDLCGIKGAYNSGTFKETKTIFIRVPVEVATLIRKTSQSLNLRSEASSIFERGVNSGGTIEALQRCVDLILEIAGGEIASEIYDLKKGDFSPWNVNLNLQRLNKLLGISIEERTVLNILKRLNLNPKKISKDIIKVTVPTYRNDLKIEEDIVEEVSRLYGYNNFPKTLPEGKIPTKTAPYFKDYRLEERIKGTLKSCGFSEIYTYSLISDKDLLNFGIDPDKVLLVDNPVSLEFEYLRPTLKINLIKALRENLPYFEKINLFELGKVYLGQSLDSIKEDYMLSGISNSKNFYEVKGILERLLEEIGVKMDLSKNIEVIGEGILFEINFTEILEKINLQKKFVPIPKYPPIVEDISLKINPKIKYDEIVNLIKKQSDLVTSITLIDEFKDKKTFRIVYQHKERNLTNEEVAKIRKRISNELKTQLKAEIV